MFAVARGSGGEPHFLLRWYGVWVGSVGRIRCNQFGESIVHARGDKVDFTMLMALI